ncbi:hypothetical protein TrVFT333_001665 [Trichoderma virens FT-333]|nr:hypothetical protein TrVFT333_001665 [Trichoderma virens FT-333]
MDNIFSKEIIKNLGGLGRYSGLTMTEKQQQRLLGRASKDDAPTAGVDRLQRLLSFDNNAGHDNFFSRACLDPDVIALAGRPGWLTWLIATSPIMARTVEFCHQHVHKSR